jgi:hypothetical protein
MGEDGCEAEYWRGESRFGDRLGARSILSGSVPGEGGGSSMMGLCLRICFTFKAVPAHAGLDLTLRCPFFTGGGFV